jgi:hypothetical protein
MVLTLVSTGRRCRKAEGAGDAGASFSSVWYRTDASRPFEKRNFFETKSEPNERFRRQILAGNYLPTERSGQDNAMNRVTLTLAIFGLASGTSERGFEQD